VDARQKFRSLCGRPGSRLPVHPPVHPEELPIHAHESPPGAGFRDGLRHRDPGSPSPPLHTKGALDVPDELRQSGVDDHPLDRELADRGRHPPHLVGQSAGNLHGLGSQSTQSEPRYNLLEPHRQILTPWPSLAPPICRSRCIEGLTQFALGGLLLSHNAPPLAVPVRAVAQASIVHLRTPAQRGRASAVRRMHRHSGEEQFRSANQVHR
jgi:hypothetical protein